MLYTCVLLLVLSVIPIFIFHSPKGVSVFALSLSPFCLFNFNILARDNKYFSTSFVFTKKERKKETTQDKKERQCYEQHTF